MHYSNNRFSLSKTRYLLRVLSSIKGRKKWVEILSRMSQKKLFVLVVGFFLMKFIYPFSLSTNKGKVSKSLTSTS